jgi:aryl-alcohol dehydrogenase-like predicted oxidoreductase
MTRDSPGWPQSISIQDVLGENGVVDILETLRKDGLTRFIGFTGLGETGALHKLVESKRFDTVQIYFNLLNPSAGYRVSDDFKSQNFMELINKSSKLGMGVVAIRVMAAGAVGGEAARRGYAAPTVDTIVLGGEYETYQNIVKKLDFLAKGEINSIPQAALKFVLMQPGVSTALVGFSNLDQIVDAAETTEKGPLNHKQINELQRQWNHSI